MRRDLDDLAAFRHTFEPEGYKGMSLFCHDCIEEHFYGWGMLEHNQQPDGRAARHAAWDVSELLRAARVPPLRGL